MMTIETLENRVLMSATIQDGASLRTDTQPAEASSGTFTLTFQGQTTAPAHVNGANFALADGSVRFLK
jgi:prepilin-type processing-associated H-X9-DG protein